MPARMKPFPNYRHFIVALVIGLLAISGLWIYEAVNKLLFSISSVIRPSFSLMWAGFRLIRSGLLLVVSLMLLAAVTGRPRAQYARWGIAVFLIGVILVILDWFSAGF